MAFAIPKNVCSSLGTGTVFGLESKLDETVKLGSTD